MSGKRNISYVKPQDPSFLAKLKAQVGYKEGPTVETKRQRLDYDENSSGSEGRPDREEERPQIVVLQSGDLNAEEVSKEEARIAKETSEARADLSRPIVFQKRQEKQTNCATVTSTSSKSVKGTKIVDKQDIKPTNNKRENQRSKLSFDVDEEDEE